MHFNLVESLAFDFSYLRQGIFLIKPMKITHQLTLSLPLLTWPCAADLFPNGDFETGGTSWEEVSGGGTYLFSYPETDGNENGFGVIDHSAADGGFGIWVGNDGGPLLLADLGLSAGSTYDFTQDMKILSGDNIGGLKLDFTTGGSDSGSTGDLRTDLIGDGSTWETYSFRITIPEGVDGFKVVPLWGVDSSVGFDNIGFIPNPIEPPVDPPVVEAGSEPEFSNGTLVSWIPTNPDKFHQPQASQDGSSWSNLGPAFWGTGTNTILDPNAAPFHRVLESDPVGPQSLINGDLEIADPGNPTCPENWVCLAGSGQTAALIDTDSFSGTSSVRLAVQNETTTTNTVVLKQELWNAGGSVTPNESYTFSFQAKQISFGDAYDQGYKLVWFDAANAPVAGADPVISGYRGGEGVWAEISASNIIAPAGAASVLVEFFCSTGAVSGAAVNGEVLIDDIRLATGIPTEPAILPTTNGPGVGLIALTKPGVNYKAQQSEDLENYTDLTGIFTGNGEIMGAGIPDGGPSHFFRILEIVEEEN